MHNGVRFFSFQHCLGHPVHTLPEAFQATRSVRPEAVALRVPGGREYTWRDYGREVRRIAEGFTALGVRSGGTIGIMLTNRPEFHLVDTAALHVGATPFSIYNTLPPAQIGYVCANAGNRIMITEQQFLPRLLQVGIAFDHIVCVDGLSPGVMSLAQLVSTSAPGFDFEATWRAVRPDDLATITYTSGTTGPPKGVELTHSNILAQLVGLGEHLPADHDDRIVSYLPAAHIADRITAHYAGIVRGIQVTSVADPHLMAAALPEVRPTVLFGVPRVWQKAEAAIESRIEAEPRRAKKALATWAFAIGRRAADAETRDMPWYRRPLIRHRLAETLVLSRVRRHMGLDRIRFAASGAAPISADVLAYFAGLGIRVTQVWGLSEAAGVSTTTTLDDPAFGSVGRPIHGAEIALAADGEIMVRGPMVMRGYHRDPEATRRAFRAGNWLATGDLGATDATGNLRVIGRKSEMIINDTGKNIAPAAVENAVKAASFLIGHVMAIGEGRPYLTALITLDPDAIAADAAVAGVLAADIDILVTRPRIRERVLDAVRDGNATVSRPEQIKRFILLDHTWTQGDEEITPKMSLRRYVVERNYAAAIESLYANPVEPGVTEVLPPPLPLDEGGVRRRRRRLPALHPPPADRRG
ncbi:long-chain fatty acid--CoA ligase [Nocardia sp. NPDC005366]|uniref:AMP-dependent synthetase/ligase n=1 Tax=Nocardia sp. NPDC005366 TaxID=3156878 RepID=UPI0033B2CDD6